jgi:hypothetical protein
VSLSTFSTPAGPADETRVGTQIQSRRCITSCRVRALYRRIIRVEEEGAAGGQFEGWQRSWRGLRVLEECLVVVWHDIEYELFGLDVFGEVLTLLAVIVGEICNFAAYAFVDAILVTPMGALVFHSSSLLTMTVF